MGEDEHDQESGVEARFLWFFHCARRSSRTARRSSRCRPCHIAPALHRFGRLRACTPQPSAVCARRARPLACSGGGARADLGRIHDACRKLVGAVALPGSCDCRGRDQTFLRARRPRPRPRAEDGPDSEWHARALLRDKRERKYSALVARGARHAFLVTTQKERARYLTCSAGGGVDDACTLDSSAKGRRRKG